MDRPARTKRFMASACDISLASTRSVAVDKALCSSSTRSDIGEPGSAMRARPLLSKMASIGPTKSLAPAGLDERLLEALE